MNPQQLGRSLFIIAHPDDEIGGAGILLQRLSEAMIVYCTDGAPDEPWFWRQYSSREDYALVRRREALEALSVAGVRGVSFLSNANSENFRDQKLHTVLGTALNLVSRLVRWYAPDSIVTTAYEGGHPDHDCCAFLSHIVGGENNVPVWEFPLYHRNACGELQLQTFVQPNGTEVALEPSPAERQRKREMIACYRSQTDLEDFIVNEAETFRPQPSYDFSKPPADVINYEKWGWKVHAAELCSQFSKVTDWRHIPVAAHSVLHKSDAATTFERRT